MSGLSEIAHLAKDLYVRTRDHHLVDMAAKIAYYSFLSLFPLILILFALAGIFGGESAFEWAMAQLQSIMPREAAEYVGGFVYDVTGVRRPDVLSLSIAFLLFSASGAVVALVESLNVIFEIEESRPLWRKYLLGMMSILAGALFYVVGLPTILASPALLDVVGLGWIVGRLRWPLVFTVLTSIVWLAYLRLPNFRRRPPRLLLLVGALIGTLLWGLVTQGLQVYLANFERFASLYGVVTGILVTMMWLHMSAFALLFGAQFAAALAVRVERRSPASQSVGGFAAIVPAAGRSARMGRDKLLLGWHDTVVVGSVVEALRAGGAEAVVVVASEDNRALQDWVRESGQSLAINSDPARGMLSSVIEGLEHLGGAEQLAATARGLLVCPGDHAGLERSTVARLCAAVSDGAALAVPTYSGRRGHPLAISPALVSEVPKLDLEVGLRQLIARHESRLVGVPVDDEAVVRDLDTPNEYEAALRTES